MKTVKYSTNLIFKIFQRLPGVALACLISIPFSIKAQQEKFPSTNKTDLTIESPGPVNIEAEEPGLILAQATIPSTASNSVNVTPTTQQSPSSTSSGTQTPVPQYTQLTPAQSYPQTNVARPPAIGSANSPYAFHSYRLSYMQSDRTIALLKALGYSTVEYSVTRGESLNESIFTAFQQSYTYPIVVKILDAAKTSLMQPSLDGGYNPASATDRLSGTYLHQSTTGAPEQRLLIVYEKQYPEQLNTLLNLLRSEVDVAASQIVIEALVIEIDTNKAQELGLKYNLVGKNNSTSIDEGISAGFQSNQRDLFGWNANRASGSYLPQHMMLMEIFLAIHPYTALWCSREDKSTWLHRGTQGIHCRWQCRSIIQPDHFSIGRQTGLDPHWYPNSKQDSGSNQLWIH